MERLELIDGQAEPVLLVLDDETIIGRGQDATMRVFDETASRRHAEIVHREGRTVLRDLGSANGTLLNGERVQGEAVLFDGDVIGIGDVRMRMRSGDDGDQPTVVPSTQDQIEAVVDPEVALPFLDSVGQEAQRHLRLVCEGAAACADAADADQLARDLLALVVEVLQPDRASICLMGAEQKLRIVSAYPEGAGLPSSRTLRQRLFDKGEAVLIRDAADEEAKSSDSILRSRYRSTLAAPLRTAEGALGVVYVESLAPGTYGADDLRALAAAARQAALAIRLLTTLSGARLVIRQLSREHAGEAPEILGSSPAIERLRDHIAKAAGAEAPVLIRGETGTGKELVARRLHAEGPRHGKPFVALNCAALVEGLLESEIFGHEKGAFTDAKARRDGRIAEAGSGTLFLDEIGELSPGLQAKLLRVLSERSYQRVGGRETLQVECRVIAATNRDLEQMVKDGTFREDLYYRLAVVILTVPPLRERDGDIDLLAEASLERLAARLGRRVPRLTEDARDALRAYPWKGNVRELLNLLERALVLLDGEELTVADLPRELRETSPAPNGGDAAAYPAESGLLGDGIFDMRAIEKRAVVAALRKTGGKKGEAAALLGIAWPTLNRKIRQYGIEPPY